MYTLGNIGFSDNPESVSPGNREFRLHSENGKDPYWNAGWMFDETTALFAWLPWNVFAIWTVRQHMNDADLLSLASELRLLFRNCA